MLRHRNLDRMIRHRVLTVACLFLLFESLRAADAADAPPNLVVLLADDLGWNAVGYHNEEFKTPNIDALVADGMELNRFYVAPMCSPTRAGLMTGRYPIRFGLGRAVIPPQRDFGLPNEEVTLAEALATLGYRHRGVFGKWHLGHRRGKWHPLKQGFTHFHGHYNGAIDYFHLTREDVRDWHTNFDTSGEQGYATDLIARNAADWIVASAKSSSPYLCYVPFNAPHAPFQVPEEAVERFPQAESRPGGRRGRRAEQNRRIYQAMVWKMDQGIGQILQAIEQTGEADKTLVWFISDNGGVGGLRDLNVPLRGSKLTVYEGGIRVPAAIRWPAKIAAGSRSDQVIGYVDVMPTLVAAAGGNIDPLSDQPIDGINVLPVVKQTGDPGESIATRPWFSYHGQQGEQNEHLAVTQRGWKLKVNGPRLTQLSQLTDGTNRVELFHLSEDLNEIKDLAADDPDRVNRLGMLLIDYRALQPQQSVPPYSVGREGFIPPKDWKLNPNHPEELVGGYAEQR